MLTTIIIFIIILGVLVFVHELGHFWVARKSGMGVEEFGFGFPPRLAGLQKIGSKWKILWGHKPPLDKNKTVFSINFIPLGGFVKILGENNEHEDDPRSFVNRPFWGRFFTLIAGVCMNVVLAWVLISAGYVFGLPTAVEGSENIPKYATLRDQQVAVVDLVPNGPAAKAGIAAGDVILKLNGQTAADINFVHDFVREHKGEQITFTVKHIQEIKDITIQSKANPGPEEGPTGIVLAFLGKLSFPWYWAPIEGAKTTWIQLSNIVSGLYDLLTSKAGLAAVGGPVKIAQLTGEVRGMGLIYLIQFTAFLSLNLAILNILPFPALDGGRVLFLLVEKVRGRRNNQKVEQWVNTVGFVFLLVLMVVVTVKDIIKK